MSRRRQQTEAITVEHRGKEIRYDTDTDTWKCRALAIEAPTLSKAKAAIEKASKQQRKLGLPALKLARSYSRGLRDMWEVKAVTIEMLALAEANYRGEAEVREAHIKNEAGERSKTNINMLYPVECRAELEAAVAKENATLEAHEAARAEREKIRPYHTKTLQQIAEEKRDQEAA